MTKRVLIIASGPTERSALPKLLEHLKSENIEVDIRIPSGHRQLRPNVVYPIIISSQYDSDEGPPDKCVILVDTDGKSPEEAIGPIQQGLQRTQLSRTAQNVKFAYAQWHLEAWYFADAANLREYLRRDVGNVNPNEPDQIQNPKHHLRQLLGDSIYTAQVSEEIAARLNPSTIAQRSSSFRTFLETIRNGDAIM